MPLLICLYCLHSALNEAALPLADFWRSCLRSWRRSTLRWTWHTLHLT